jgi:GTP-binding protein EngB required for normal cell division
MANLVERKQNLITVMERYGVVLDRWDNKERKKALLSTRDAIEWGRYQIALIGYTKRGKSTLLNALLGDATHYNIAPVKTDTCTAAIVKYLDSKLYPDAPGTEGAIISFNDGRNPAHIEPADIVRYVDQTHADFFKDDADKIDRIEIYGNFPLIEKKGVIVDTPGLGAVYDQDYLTTSILPEVDVILSPIATDLPLEKGEIEFLHALPPSEKVKLMFVLTKTDEVDREELNEIISGINAALGKIKSGSVPRLYKTAAKRVIDAWKAGKTPQEVEAVKKMCGMAEFEAALQDKLEKSAGVTELINIQRNALGDYFDADKRRLEGIKEALAIDVTKLEQEKKALEVFYDSTKNQFKNNTNELKKKWSKEVSKFIIRFENKEGAIAERLVTAVDKENLFTLIGYSKKMERKIQAVLQQELEGELADLNDKLANLVTGFAEKLKSDIDEEVAIYGRAVIASNLSREIGALIGGGVAVGGGLWGTTTALTAIGGISAVAQGLATASAASSGAAENAGLLSWLGLKLLGKGKMADAGMGLATAQGGMVSALIGGVVPIIGGIVVAKLAISFGTSFAKNKTKEIIPKMVAKGIEETVGFIKDSAEKALDAVLSQFQTQLEELLEEKEGTLDSTIESLKNLNKENKLREIERDLQEINELRTALNNV